MDTGGALGPSLPLGKEESIMGSYIPNTRAQQEAMLAALGVDRVEDLFAAVPREMLVDRLDLPEGLSELEVRRQVTAMAAKNKIYDTVLRGAGAYRHFIPSVVKSVVSREELVTAYNPYQEARASCNPFLSTRP